MPPQRGKRGGAGKACLVKACAYACTLPLGLFACNNKTAGCCLLKLLSTTCPSGADLPVHLTRLLRVLLAALPAEIVAFPGTPLGVLALPDNEVLLFALADDQGQAGASGLGTSPLVSGTLPAAATRLLLLCVSSAALSCCLGCGCSPCVSKGRAGRLSWGRCWSQLLAGTGTLALGSRRRCLVLEHWSVSPVSASCCKPFPTRHYWCSCSRLQVGTRLSRPCPPRHHPRQQARS